MSNLIDLDGFMAGGVMIPDPASMLLGQSGVYWAKGGTVIPGNPNGDHGFNWFQEANDTLKVANDTIWTTFTPSTTYDKYAGGRVPGIDAEGLVDYSQNGRNITFTLFQDATIYARVEGLIIRYFHSGSWHTFVNNACGYALRVDGMVDMGSLMGGFAGQTDYGYYRFFDDSRGYAIDNDAKMRIPARRMNSNGTAVCVHVSTWQNGWNVGAPRIGDGQGDWNVYSPMAFCCSSTHSIALTAGTHTIGVDIFTSSNGNACATYEGPAYSSVQSLTGGSLTISTVNSWGTVGAGVIDLTGTCFDQNATFPYPVNGNVFSHGEGDAYNSAGVIADAAADGVTGLTSSGFASDQVTMNRVCDRIHGTGSEARDIGARGYNSPGNNTIIKYNSGHWVRIGAGSYNSHLSSSFKCTDPAPASIWYYGMWRQGVNARITYTAPTGYFYPVIGVGFCEGGGGTGDGVPDGDGNGGFLGGGSTPIGTPPGGGGGGCFRAGTLITMANGSLKPIELIGVGDEVLGARLPFVPNDEDRAGLYSWTATDALFVSPQSSTVTWVMPPARFYRHFSVNGGLMLVTPEHPILIFRNGTYRFLPALKLRVGDLVMSPAGERTRVDSIESVMCDEPYFNFSCDGSHTYVAGGVVVHNMPNNAVGNDINKV